jgi:hypothetical protein
MHTFKVVKEPHGWAVRLGCAMTTPFRSRTLAIEEARSLCDALRRHGEIAEVVVEIDETEKSLPACGTLVRSGLEALLSRSSRHDA